MKKKEDNIYTEFKKFIELNHLVSKNDKILIGVSGGVDSMVLLNLFLTYSRELDNTLGIAHVNYNLRGKESEADAKLVEKIAIEEEIPFYLNSTKIKKSGRNKSIQEEARKIRYGFYETICKREGYHKVAIAHNSNDNAETILLNLIRGTGISGLRGIPIKRDNIIRPLLFSDRKLIMDYAKRQKLKFRTDKSNLKPKYNRNFLRLQIFPQLQKRINPNLIQNINNFSNIFRNFENFILCSTKIFSSSIINYESANEICLDIQKLNNYINCLKEYILLDIAKRYCKIVISTKHLNSLLHLLQNQTGKRISLNKEWSVWKDRKFLVFSKYENLTGKEEIEVREEIITESFVLRHTKIDGSDVKFTKNPKIEYIDQNSISGKLYVRKWKVGDYFYPIGMTGKKKISDFLTDIKFRSSSKNDIFVLLNSNKIVWVCGHRLDDRFKITENSKDVIKLEIINKKEPN